MACNACLEKLYLKRLELRIQHAKRESIFIQETANQQPKPLS